MDRLGDDFFPSPGGAEDKRIDGAAGDGQGKLNDLPHGLALAHDLLGLVVFLNGPHQMRVALGEEPVRLFQLALRVFRSAMSCERWYSRLSTLTSIMPKASASRT